MSARILRRRRAGMEPGFNLTPMLDMIFYLLFFFILATKIRDDNEQRMDVKLPQAASSVEAAAKREPPPSLTLGADGRVFFKGREMVKEELDLELTYLAAKGQQEISIRGDEKVDYGRVIEVMDWCKLAGLKTVLLDMKRVPLEAPASN